MLVFIKKVGSNPPRYYSSTVRNSFS